MTMSAAPSPACSLAATGEGRYALAGTVGFRTARELLTAGQGLLVTGPAVIDLAGVTATDSAGLALLLCWLAEARAAGRTLHFEHVTDQLRAIARISDAESLLDTGV